MLLLWKLMLKIINTHHCHSHLNSSDIFMKSSRFLSTVSQKLVNIYKFQKWTFNFIWLHITCKILLVVSLYMGKPTSHTIWEIRFVRLCQPVSVGYWAIIDIRCIIITVCFCSLNNKIYNRKTNHVYDYTGYYIIYFHCFDNQIWCTYILY